MKLVIQKYFFHTQLFFILKIMKIKPVNKQIKEMFSKTLNLPKSNFILHPKYNEIEPLYMNEITTSIFFQFKTI